MVRSARVIDGTLLAMLALLAALACLAHWRGGTELLGRGLAGGAGTLLRYAPVVALSFLAAGLVQELIPRDWIRDTLGESSGLRGILIATGAGVITPAGPFISMPLAALLLRAGAAPGPVAAFVTGWALLALHRLVAWEVPILGWRFALLRYALCLVMPVLAGLLMRLVLRG